jgi:DNA-directed RNA polymerase sigma subunit (sigma70/sigma32)
MHPPFTYLWEVFSIPPVTATEERELATKSLAGDQSAKDRLIRSHLALVVSVAREYLGRGLDMLDLIEEGNMGLLRAMESLASWSNGRLAEFATGFIAQRIESELADLEPT